MIGRTPIARSLGAAKLTTLLCLSLFLVGCASLDRTKDGLEVYRVTNDQPGHELARTEQFLVPVGTVILIRGLEFEPGSSTLTPSQRLVIQQIFNCIEEITENTVGDTNAARVLKFKKMQFEIRGYGDFTNARSETRLAKERAQAVSDFLTYLGTPSWRLKTTGVAMNSSKKPGQIEFIRTR